MKIIGITGGVGSGKSAILRWMEEHYSCRIIMADEVGHRVIRRGEAAYEPLTQLLAAVPGGPLLAEDGEIDRGEMSARIFAHPALRQQVNELIHPAVKEYIQKELDAEREKALTGAPDCVDCCVLEAALLIECGYRASVDEMWYIYCDEQVRLQRLHSSRGYTQEKARNIMDSQLSEEEFRKGSDVVIDNSGDFSETCRQVEAALQRLTGGEGALQQRVRDPIGETACADFSSRCGPPSAAARGIR